MAARLRTLRGFSRRWSAGAALLGASGLAIVARLTGRDAQALSAALVTDRTRRIDVGVLRWAARLPQATLPAPTGRAAVGSDVVQVIDRARRARRLLLTRSYRARSGARCASRAAYTS